MPKYTVMEDGDIIFTSNKLASCLVIMRELSDSQVELFESGDRLLYNEAGCSAFHIEENLTGE